MTITQRDILYSEWRVQYGNCAEGELYSQWKCSIAIIIRGYMY